MSLHIVILAAGQGTRMKSSMPKVMHRLAGKPLLSHVLDTARSLDAKAISVVLGHGKEQVLAELPLSDVKWAYQEEQRGTGHALMQALPHIDSASQVLILYGDVPLITESTLRQLISATPIDTLGVLTAVLEKPKGYGRIVRDASGRVAQIVECRDTTGQQQSIQEVNTGVLVLPANRLAAWLAKLEPKNVQGELYLTDLIERAVAENCPIATYQVEDSTEIMGVNDRLQLTQLERVFQQHQAEQLALAGVTLIDPARLDIRGQVRVASDIVIDVNVILEGQVSLGSQVKIGPNVILRDVIVGDGCEIKANSIIEEATLGQRCVVGPFARIRPGTQLDEMARVGNFVEIKNAQIGHGSKVNHLSYIGDTRIGKAVNVGAGTITCNYDGVNKHRTEIKDGAFIGSGTELVAPVSIGCYATIAAGSTITRDTPDNRLVVARSRQRVIENWQRTQPKGSDAKDDTSKEK